MNEELSIDDINEEFDRAKEEAASAEQKAVESPEAVVETSVSSEQTEKAEEEAKPEEPQKPAYEIPKQVEINAFRKRPLAELYQILESLPVRIQANSTKAQLVYDILTFYGKEGCEITGSGVVEQAKESYAMLRDPERSFKTSPDDMYLAGEFIESMASSRGI